MTAPLTRAEVREIILETLEEVITEMRDLNRGPGKSHSPLLRAWKAVRNCLDKPEATHDGRGT
jgi:hypothetical protein